MLPAHLELHVATDVAGKTWSLNPEHRFIVGILNLEGWLTNAPSLTHVADGMTRGRLHFYFLSPGGDKESAYRFWCNKVHSTHMCMFLSFYN